MQSSLRDWILSLEENNLLARIDKEIDPRHIAAMVSQNYKKATLVENIKGYDVPILANAVSNRSMLALALGTSEDALIQSLDEKMHRLIKPRIVESAPCQEVVKIGEDNVDLTEFPIYLQHEFDGGPYISAGVLVANDPVTHVPNLGIYRMMFRTKKETGIDLTAPHKLRRYYQTAINQQENMKDTEKKSLEVACVIGLHGIDMLSSVATAPSDIDEYEVMGGFRGEPLELVSCKTIDVLVPANAEIILECEVPLSGWIADEGPYGEFTGTYGGLKKNPTLEIKAITHRKSPILQSATHGGSHPGWTDFYLLIPIFESQIRNALRSANIDVRALRFHPGSSGLWLIASIKKWSEGDGKNALMLMLSASNQNFPKYAVVVDDDIDIYDDDKVYWAMTMRAQPAEDAMIFNDLKCIPLDPSLPTEMPPITTSKMGFDATRPLNRPAFRFSMCLPPFLSELKLNDGTHDAPSAKTGTLTRAEMHLAAKRKTDAEKVNLEQIQERVRTVLARMVELLNSDRAYFVDILKLFPSEEYRTVLLAWSTLRSVYLANVKRDNTGRYYMTNS